MKNRIVRLIILIILILPIMIKAESVKYNPDAINKANNYIRLARFSDRKKYLDLDTNLYVYENGYITSIGDYKTGGMLSKTEYELSQVGETSYLTLGQKYWTLTPVQGTNKQYYVENYLDEKARSEEAGVRSTIYAKPEVYVVGNGTYTLPWEFKLYHTVKITPKAFGRVDCLDSNCTKNNTTVTREKIESGTDANFKVIPDNGYKYLANDSCNLKKTSGQNYKISNITSDIRCIVEFYPRTYTLKLMPGSGVTYRTNPSPDKIYLKYTVGTYSNPEATTVLNQIEKPSRIGYQFRGYYYGDTEVIDRDGKLVESQRKAITGFNLAGDDIQELVAHWEPNIMYITYDPNGATDYNDPNNSRTATLLYDGSNYSASTGLPNYACKKGDCWFAFSKPGYHGTYYWLVGSTSSITKINVSTPFAKNQDMFTGNQRTSFEDNYKTYVTLYAEWIACEAGTYKGPGEGGTTCTGCTAGSFQSSSGQGSCIDCAVASYTNSQGQTSCTACQPSGSAGANGTTSAVGQTSCNASCNKAHVATWKTASWKTDNTGVNNLCTINTCSAGYKLSGNLCVADSFTVTFNVNSGDAWTSTTCGSGYTFNSSSKTCTKAYTYNGTYSSLPTPTRTGYTFAGWYTSASGGTQITTSSTVSITSATTYYAHWDASFQEQDIPEIIIDGNEVLCDKYSKYDDGTPVNFSSCEYITPHLQINAHYNNGTSTVNIKTYYTMHPKNGYGINNGTFYVGGSTENGNTNAGLYINDSLKVEMSYTSGTYRIVKRDSYVDDTALYLHTSSVNPYVYTFTINHNDSGTASFYVELINNAVTQKTSNGARPYDICGDHGGINVPRQLVTLHAQ